MKTRILNSRRPRGFTLMETVIAIGVLSVLLTGFLIVFIPAADGIKRSISSQEADRLVAALEQELVNTRTGETPPPLDDAATGFEKALWRIRFSTGPIPDNKDTVGQTENALLVYQYRGNPADLSPDGSPEPVTDATGKKAGQDYTLVPMMRRKSSPRFLEELPAVEGSVYLVKCVQMVNRLKKDDDTVLLVRLDHDNKNNPIKIREDRGLVGPTYRGEIVNPEVAPESADRPADYPLGPFDKPADYPDAVIAFAAEFYPVPSKATGFFGPAGGFEKFYVRSVKPTFTRNLAIRR